MKQDLEKKDPWHRDSEVILNAVCELNELLTHKSDFVTGVSLAREGQRNYDLLKG